MSNTGVKDMKPQWVIHTILKHEKSLTRMHAAQVSASVEHVFFRWPVLWKLNDRIRPLTNTSSSVFSMSGAHQDASIFTPLDHRVQILL